MTTMIMLVGVSATHNSIHVSVSPTLELFPLWKLFVYSWLVSLLAISGKNNTQEQKTCEFLFVREPYFLGSNLKMNIPIFLCTV